MRSVGVTLTDRLRVLNVAPSRFGAATVASVLSNEGGYDVVASCYTAATASSLVATLRPDVIVANSFLGSGSAWDIVRGEVPLVLLVMAPPNSDRVARLGVAGYITRESTAADLVDAVRAVHDGFHWYPDGLAASDHDDLGDELTPREFEVLQCLARAMTVSAIAADLHISVHTVRNHVKSLRQKFRANSQLELVVRAAERGLITSFFRAPRLVGK